MRVHPLTVPALLLTLTLAGCGGGGSAPAATPPANQPPPTTSGTVTPTSLSFGDTPVSASAAAQTVTLKNTGTTALSGTIAVSGTDAGDFAQTNTCGTSLAAGASCTVSVTFTPSATGARTATLTATVNGTTIPGVTLTGNGTGVAASLSPGSLTFGNTQTGTTAAAQTLTLSNTGTTALAASLSLGGTDAGDFAQTNTCGTSLAADANCTISITFTPSATGSEAASLNATVAGVALTGVALGGTGVNAAASFSPSSHNFGSWDFATKPVASSSAASFTLTNNTASAQTLSGIGVTGTDAGDFAETNNCGASLAASGTCTLSVTFTPGAVGPRSAALGVTVGGVTLTGVALTGTGAVPTATLSATSLSFGSTEYATQTVTLSNSAGDPLKISSIQINGANASDFVNVNNCSSGLEAASACTVTVTFKPTAAGARSATLDFSDNAYNNPSQSVDLSGTGAAGIALVNPNSGPLAGGTIVSISGNGFQPGATVSFGANAATAVSMNAAGTLLQATAPAGTAGSVAVAVNNPGGGGSLSLPAAFTYSSEQPGCGTDCGNVGDPYEGAGAPTTFTPITACEDISADGYYKVTQDLSGSISAQDSNCLHIYYVDPSPTSAAPFTLDLGGHTITGTVKIEGGGGPYVVMNGIITCDTSVINQLPGNAGECLNWSVADGRIHHITIENTNLSPLTNIFIAGQVSSTVTSPVLELDHITSTVVTTSPGDARSRNIIDDGTRGIDPTIVSVPIEGHNDLLTCADGASACQGFEMWDSPNSYIHNNQIVLPATCANCSDAARGVLLDSNSDNTVIAYNDFQVYGNRAVRVRDSHHISIHDNLLENITSAVETAWGRYAAIHIGETNGIIDDDFVSIYNNTFQLGAAGSGVTSNGATDIYVYDNTVSCTACTVFAKTDVPDSASEDPDDQTGTTITVSNNDVSALDALGIAAVNACGPVADGTFPTHCSGSATATSSATVCNSGTTLPLGNGTINTLATPPCPTSPVAPPTAPAPVNLRARRPPQVPTAGIGQGRG